MTTHTSSAAPARYAMPPSVADIAAKLGVSPAQVCKLDANESPYGPPPVVTNALQRLLAEDSTALSPSRYPDASATDLRMALARYTGVHSEQIVVGNGSDELVGLLVDMLSPGDEVVVCEPTFGLYAVAAGWRGVRVIDVGLEDDFTVPRDRLLAAITPATKLVFLCSPNNPTGTPLARETLLAALERAEALTPAQSGPLLVVDEAYYEVNALGGGEAWTAAPLVTDGRRVVVLRTFSKVFGLAGMRVGYGLGSPEVAARLRERKQPYNVNIAGLLAARAALDDFDWLRERAALLVGERGRLGHALAALDGLSVYPSATNFLLVDFGGPALREAVWQALIDRGILVRRLSGERLAGCLRITVGKPEENDRLLVALREMLREVREGVAAPKETE
ncbi:MAG: histidinol-phosphate transaminase [Ktedonobacterales bacterium]